MGLLYGRAGRLTARFGGFGPGRVGDGHGKAINHSRHREALLQRTSPRAGVGTEAGPPGNFAAHDFGTSDGYEYFLRVGALRNLAARMEEAGLAIGEYFIK
jgi:hypothetical protein